jgi:hypothetical protein
LHQDDGQDDSQRILADKLADVAIRREGIIDARLEAVILEATKPIETHLIDFQAMMQARAKGRKSRHIPTTLSLIREVCKDAEFGTPNDRRDEPGDCRNSRQGNSVRTAQARIVAMKAFTRWLADYGKLSYDPLRSIKRGSIKKADRVKHRRMLRPEEWPYLHGGTMMAGDHHGMNPFERVTLYAVATQNRLATRRVATHYQGRHIPCRRKAVH